jgi:Tfp pilus assembly pilus retraction ATPase PilT
MVQTGKGEGMQTMSSSLLELIQRGHITRKQAITATNNPKFFDEV